MGTSSNTNVQTLDNRSVADANGQSATNGSNTAKDYAQVNTPRISINAAGKNLSTTTNLTLNSTLTDYGAINKALTFAGSAQTEAQKTVKDVLGVAEGNFDKTTSALTEAYKDAKGGALVLQNVTIGMMVTIAALGYFFFVGRKKS